ncbi:hypothetical protein JGG59_24115 [Salmonella enterica subsp. enterica serovar Derby]|nr:hypothetical protein [Salmonella enterica subsp. enterica serovar Derby]
MKPDYKKIYKDLIRMKFPDKKEKCQFFFQKEEISALDVISINNLIFTGGKKYETSINGRFRSYSQSTILKILEYQKANNLNNTNTAEYFGLSRNTVAKWKKLFME